MKICGCKESNNISINIDSSHIYVYIVMDFFTDFFFGVAYVEEFSKICPIFFINSNSIVNEYIELPIIENHNFKNDITYENNEHNNKFNKFKYIYVDDKFEYIFFSLCSSAGLYFYIIIN